MNKQPKVTEQTKQNFINAFCELYSQKPIEKISIQELASKTGYNRSTFYQYFTDIYDLLEVVENRILDEVRSGLSNQPDPVDGIQEALHCLESEEHFLVLQALLGNYGTSHFLERLKKEIPFEKLNLGFEENDPLTPYYIEFYISTSLSLFRLWLQRSKDMSSEDLFNLMSKLYSDGINAYLDRR